MARKYTSISVETTLSATISSSATSITVADAAALIGDATLSAGNVDQFTVAIDPETVNEEILFVTAANTATNTLTVQRNRAGTTPIIHNTGATIKHVLTGDDLNAFASAVSPISTMRFTGATTGSTTVQASATASGTLTLPAATDTLVGKATTDTLTNKSVSLASNTLTGTTAQFNTALTDNDFATVAGAETLTNKNLTSGTNTFPTSLVTTTGSQTLSSKTIDYNSNTITNLPTAPSQTLLSTTTLSGGSTNITGISGSYNELYIHAYGLAGNSGQSISMYFNNPSSIECTQMIGWTNENGGSPTNGVLFERYTNQLNLTSPTSKVGANTNNWLIKISNYTSGIAGRYASVEYNGYYVNNANGYNIIVNGTGKLDINTTAITSIGFSSSGQPFTGGTIKIYGVK